MPEFVTDINTYWRLEKETINLIMDIYAKSGHGKGLASEGFAEEMHNKGYQIIVIADPKDEIEWAYAMFEPKASYHLKNLKKYSKKPSKKSVKLYHPFTFNIPKILLPDINFYTFSLKELGRKEWGILAETEWETDSMRSLLKTSRDISKDDGIYDFLHKMRDSIKGRTIKTEKRAFSYDKNLFYLDVRSGIAKSVTQIANYLEPFKEDYFLSKDSNPFKLNWKEILSDQKNYHVFFSKWILDEKLKDFIVLALFTQIIKNKDYAKYPICIIIPEVRKLTPFKPQGHKIFLAICLKENKSTIRAMGKGISCITDSQSFSDVDKNVRESGNLTLFGELSTSDAESVAKSMNYKRSIRDLLYQMDRGRGTFLIAYDEKMGTIIPWFPSHCHAEPKYNFDYFLKRYEKEYPGKMRRYTDIIEIMKKEYKEEENRIRDKIKRIEKLEKERLEKEKKEKEESKEKKERIDEKIDKAREREFKSKKQVMKLVYEFKKDNPKISWRELGRKFGIDTKTAQKYFKDCEEGNLEEEVLMENGISEM